LALFGFVFHRRLTAKSLIYTCHKRAYADFAYSKIGFVFSNKVESSFLINREDREDRRERNMKLYVFIIQSVINISINSAFSAVKT
jgi:hypothetical protein